MSEFLQLLLQSLCLLLPLLAANQGAMLARRFNLQGSRTPISVCYLGKNKTWAPYYTGPALSLSILCLLVWLNTPLTKKVFGLQDGYDLIEVGILLGLAAVAGDHIKSAVKRSPWVDKEPGAPWWPDRIDFAVMGGAVAWLIIPPVSFVQIVLMVAMAWPIHYIGNRIGFWLGSRDTPH